ncbi:MAG: Nramp family divalent metal transporter [Alicyclobacillus sp.]|nr:Nramp family divalent metal transporter [Alicyclobacillus sp.]
MSHFAVSEPAAKTSARREQRVVRAGQLALKGKRKGIRGLLPFIGPSLIAAIAYVDPGNYATNIGSGAAYGYRLLWVVVLANLMAMVMQNLSAKLGIATGKSLPELCRERFPRGLSLTLWLVAEVAAMATDLAEFLGASLALNLLLGIPMWAAALVTAMATYGILMLEHYGFRPLEIFVGSLLAVIALCYVVETLFSHPDWHAIAVHSVTPWLGGSDSVLLAVGIIGATVMPHAIYLHSGLTQRRIVPRGREEMVRLYRYERLDVVLAMSVAGLVNLAMVYMAASVFHGTGHTSVASLSEAYRTLTPLLGPAAAAVFLTSLLASGLSSSAVGTMAGQVIMQGFVGFTIPVWIRRVVTMVPPLAVIAAGVDPMRALVLSQVVLSLALPAPLVTLVWFTRDRKLMGVLVNRGWVTALAVFITAVVIGLNGTLLYSAFGGTV